MVIVVDVFLAGAVLSAVHHAEVVAHRVGEPFGSIVRAVAVTVIEVRPDRDADGVGRQGHGHLARDTVFAAVMITCNGIIGLSILLGALREGPRPSIRGSATAFATVATLATLCLVLPTFTTSATGPEFTSSQLAFAAVASLALYALFLVVQTFRHRDYFLPPGATATEDEHASGPRRPRRCGAWGYCSSRWWLSSGWPRPPRPLSRTRSRRSALRTRRWASRSRCSCLPRSRSPPPATPAGHESGELQPGLRIGDGEHRPDHPRSRLHRSGSRDRSRSGSARPRSSCSCSRRW